MQSQFSCTLFFEKSLNFLQTAVKFDCILLCKFCQLNANHIVYPFSPLYYFCKACFNEFFWFETSVSLRKQTGRSLQIY
ncbi:hypothetical protein EGR_07869 [Echinococcus granulosus]|uniref:Uncharacterized protein n=1 Tax=Echinococcus granulosus TaxID=6210 RepID=W6UUZ7_ECHGR|nr:hypothetical protein EGR_07869 [Echinococcus granulosus]EUB57259.1 hypothetical protein EGR_07869 [Echinococcus granulosus]